MQQRYHPYALRPAFFESSVSPSPSPPPDSPYALTRSLTSNRGLPPPHPPSTDRFHHYTRYASTSRYEQPFRRAPNYYRTSLPPSKSSLRSILASPTDCSYRNASTSRRSFYEESFTRAPSDYRASTSATPPPESSLRTILAPPTDCSYRNGSTSRRSFYEESFTRAPSDHRASTSETPPPEPPPRTTRVSPTDRSYHDTRNAFTSRRSFYEESFTRAPSDYRASPSITPPPATIRPSPAERSYHDTRNASTSRRSFYEEPCTRAPDYYRASTSASPPPESPPQAKRASPTDHSYHDTRYAPTSRRSSYEESYTRAPDYYRASTSVNLPPIRAPPTGYHDTRNASTSRPSFYEQPFSRAPNYRASTSASPPPRSPLVTSRSGRSHHDTPTSRSSFYEQPYVPAPIHSRASTSAIPPPGFPHRTRVASPTDRSHHNAPYPSTSGRSFYEQPFPRAPNHSKASTSAVPLPGFPHRTRVASPTDRHYNAPYPSTSRRPVYEQPLPSVPSHNRASTSAVPPPEHADRTSRATPADCSYEDTSTSQPSSYEQPFARMPYYRAYTSAMPPPTAPFSQNKHKGVTFAVNLPGNTPFRYASVQPNAKGVVIKFDTPIVNAEQVLTEPPQEANGEITPVRLVFPDERAAKPKMLGPMGEELFKRREDGSRLVLKEWERIRKKFEAEEEVFFTGYIKSRRQFDDISRKLLRCLEKDCPSKHRFTRCNSLKTHVVAHYTKLVLPAHGETEKSPSFLARFEVATKEGEARWHSKYLDMDENFKSLKSMIDDARLWCQSM